MSEPKPTYITAALDLTETKSAEAIDTFRDEWDFLSNFFPVPVEIEGIIYPTTEHAFQAMKTREVGERYSVRDAATPAVAKRKGKKVSLRENWHTERFAVMEQVLRAKFSAPHLRDKLLATGDRFLIEGNTWRDTTWGMVRDKTTGEWRGRNELGKLLMKLRNEIRNESNDDARVDKTTDGSDGELITLALKMREVAYAPYSRYHVGAAVRTDSGATFGGCNVENASYGLCNCAERTAIFSAVATGARVITEVVVATDDGGSPCGACRQVLAEFAPRDAPLRVVLINKAGNMVRQTTIAELLPLAFNLQP
ncbi:MAG: cytidine deaminase [Akkermansiaceae bacterium]|nr:cytidine deaminase [Armatimonadota bacterium]